MEKFEDLIKKIVYTGVGFVSLTAEKMKKTIDNLVEDGKISADEGKKIIKDFKKNADTKKDELEDELKKIVEKTFKTLNIATKDDLEKLENRISLLESMLLKGKSKKGKDSDKESDKASGSKKDSKKDKK